MSKAARKAQGTTPSKLQSIIYRRALEHWKWSEDPQALAEEQKGGFEVFIWQKGEK